MMLVSGTPVYLGVDPGIDGALALVGPDERLVAVVDTPSRLIGKKRVVHAGAVRTWLSIYADLQAHPIIEQVGASAGRASSFAFGRSLGNIEGAVAHVGKADVPPRYVSPQTWKPAVGLSSADKGAARALAAKLWPHHAEKFALVKHADRAEAALIALYGVRTHRDCFA